jgi:hypothetical protein
LRIVCDTIVPITVGRCSRGRPLRRATMNAREGSPRRAGSVADMSTPMNVPCSASARRSRAFGIAARMIACHAAARTAIEAHISASAITTHHGVAATRLWPTWSTPTRCSASHDSAAPAPPAIAIAPRRRARLTGERSSGTLGSRLASR